MQIDDRGGLTRWQWLCLIEGAPTIFLAIITYKLLADPATVRCKYYPLENCLFTTSFGFTTKGLDQCSKDMLTARLLADEKEMNDDSNQPLSHQIRSVCLDWKIWFCILIYMCALTPFYGLNSFLPTIIEDMCYANTTNATNAATELLTVPPYIASFLTTLFSSWTAGRLNERSNHIMILLFIQIIGFLYLILAEKYLYIGAMIIGIGMLSCNALTLSWMTNNISNHTKRAIAVALIFAFGGFGAMISEQIYPEFDKALLKQGHWIVIGILCFTFTLVLLLKLLLKFENRRRRILIATQLQIEAIADGREMLPDTVNFV